MPSPGSSDARRTIRPFPDLGPVDPPAVETRPDAIIPGPASRSAMVIVVEENEAQGFSVTWRSIFAAMSQVMELHVDDLDFDLPNEVEALIGSSGRAANRLVKAIREGFAEMVAEIVGEARQAVGSSPPPGLDALLRTLPQRLVAPTGFDAFRNEYGEAAFGQILQTMAAPYYSKVVLLTDTGATFDRFTSTLQQLHRDGYVIDILLDIHGCGSETTMNNANCSEDYLVFSDQHATAADIEKLGGGQKLNVNAVYMVSCWGSNFNAAWVDGVGARAANGSRELNYYVLLSPFVFMAAWTRGGASLAQAAEAAYDRDRALLNGKKREIPFTLYTNPLTGKKKKVAVPIGGTWQMLMNRQLARQYGKDRKRPVDNVASSERVACHDTHRI